MKKIISLFNRNYDGNRLVRNEVVPGAEWVLHGEGIATTKWDGTACLIQDSKLYKRYDAKAGKKPPTGFIPAQPDPDPVTGHWPGWIAVGNGPEDRWHREAWEEGDWAYISSTVKDWTYELVGPKIQGNPYGLPYHILRAHAEDTIGFEYPITFDGIRDFLANYEAEGIVWWRNPNDLDCDKVKIKRKDFNLPWPISR